MKSNYPLADRATAFAIPDVEAPSSRAVSTRDPGAREEAFAVLASGHDPPALHPADDEVVQCPRGILALALRLESWGTP